MKRGCDLLIWLSHYQDQKIAASFHSAAPTGGLGVACALQIPVGARKAGITRLCFFALRHHRVWAMRLSIGGLGYWQSCWSRTLSRCRSCQVKRGCDLLIWFSHHQDQKIAASFHSAAPTGSSYSLVAQESPVHCKSLWDQGRLGPPGYSSSPSGTTRFCDR